jgi:dihydropteroate synthase
MRSRHTLKARSCRIALGGKTAIMGILNVTPDSFSDGGLFNDTESAVQHALDLIEAGAAIIDIGGESTRPGSEPVDAAVECERIVPVIKALKDRDVCLSADTWKSEVAAAALDAGAHMVNDITALLGDPDMPAVIRSYDAAVCLMHNAVLYRSDAPGHFPAFGLNRPQVLTALAPLDIIAAVERYFDLALQTAKKAGISADHIVLDPGFGFGVTDLENKKLFNHLPALTIRPYPWLVALSRKRFVQHLAGSDLPVDEVTAWLGQSAAFAGAHILRVHDVRCQKRCTDVADAVMEAH